jgi:hypothetical protein
MLGRVALSGLLALLLACQGNGDRARIALGGASADGALPGDALGPLQQAIAAREYEASRQGEDLQAPNRAHNLRTYFAPTGIRVHDRTAVGSPELVSMKLRALGRGEASREVEPGQVTSAGARVEISRPGLVEWYENSPSGLEQGFTLESRPDAGDGDLWVELALSGATARALGDSIELATGAGRKLHYTKLLAQDARGESIPARMELAGPQRLRLVIADADAVYPLTIDPLLTSAADTNLEGDQPNAQLGSSVASAGDVNGDGYADVIVGAMNYDSGQTDEGAAFVFLGSATGIASGSPASAAQLESDQEVAYLGGSVAGAGDVNGDGYDDVIVGAIDYNAGQAFEGAAFVFHGGPSGIPDGTPLTAATQLESNQAGDLFFKSSFGSSVAGAGDVNGDGYADVIVGARSYRDTGGVSNGAAFLFLGSASGVADGSPVTAATRFEPAASDPEFTSLGTSVASAGDVNSDGYADVIIGASGWESGLTEDGEGAAFIFQGSAVGIPSGTLASASTRLEGNQLSASFGTSVSGAGDMNGDGHSDVIVGAPLYDAGQMEEGAAFVFLGGASGIANGAAAWTRFESNFSSPVVPVQFGRSVAGAGDVNGDGFADVIIGAYNYPSGISNSGAGFVFLGRTAGVIGHGPADAYSAIYSDQNSSGLGLSVDSAGDVNGDGYADVIIGSLFHDAGQADTREGAALLYLGGGFTLRGAGELVFDGRRESNQANAGFGRSVASAGDVNGDGFADVIAGAPEYGFGPMTPERSGAAFIFHGSSSGIPSGSTDTAATGLEADEANTDARFGTSVASAGDVNADGYSDVIVGAPFYVTASGNQGAAFVFLGSATGIADGGPQTADVELEAGPGSGQEFGTSVASAGDVNGDGYSDVIVGAPRENAAYLFLGSPTGIPSGTLVPPRRLVLLQSNAVFGGGVSSAGDVNGDGFADVIVSAMGYDAGQLMDAGAAFIFLGSATGIASGDTSTAATRIEGGSSSAGLGWSVARAGDVNGDGYSDVMVGNLPVAGAQLGVFHGSAAGIQGTSMLTANSVVVGVGGVPLEAAGDVNGDGYADVLLGTSLVLGSASGVPSGLVNDVRSANFGSSFALAGAGDVDGDGFADVITGNPNYTSGQEDEGAADIYLGNGNYPGRLLLLRQVRFDGTIIAPWGHSAYENQFFVVMHQSNPEGRALVRLEVETCPTPLPFGDPGCVWSRFPQWGFGGQSFDVRGLEAGRVYRWRARSLYAPVSILKPGITTPPNPAHGPWRRIDAQTIGADIRTLPVVADMDGDGFADEEDNCPVFAQEDQADADEDGRGDACECTDQNGDGFNTVSDLVAINTAIFNPLLATPLCDGNNDDECNVNDIIAANVEIFSAGSTSTCGRQPLPGP